MPNPGIRARGVQDVLALGVVECVPGCRQQVEAMGQEDAAGNVQPAKMRISFFTQKCEPKAPRVVRQQIQAGVPGLEPSRQQIHSQGKTIHFHKQGDDEG